MNRTRRFSGSWEGRRGVLGGAWRRYSCELGGVVLESRGYVAEKKVVDMVELLGKTRLWKSNVRMVTACMTEWNAICKAQQGWADLPNQGDLSTFIRLVAHHPFFSCCM